MAGARHDSPRPREGEGWHIGSALLACHPVGLERWKLLCASDLQKAVWLSLCLWYVVEIHTHLFSVHGFHLTNAIQLFPTQTLKKKKEKKRYAWCCDFCLACCCVRERCIASHLFEIWNNCYLSELVSHSMGVSLSKLSVVFFSRQSAGFLEMERAVWNLLSLKIDETWHMCLGGSGNI